VHFVSGLMESGVESPCCIGRPVGRRGVGWCGGAPSIATGVARRAVQGQPGPSPPHPETAPPGHQLGRI
jgi:hypothetical protein